MENASFPAFQSGNTSLLTRIEKQASSLSEILCIHAIGEALSSQHWEHLPALPLAVDPASTIILEAIQYAATRIADMQIAETVGQLCLQNALAKMETVRLPSGESLPPQWLAGLQHKAEKLCTQQTIHALGGVLSLQSWDHCLLQSFTPLLPRSVVQSITSKAEQLSAQMVIQELAGQTMHAQWDCLNSHTSLSSGSASTLAASIAEKAALFSTNLVGSALSEALHTQRWKILMEQPLDTVRQLEQIALHVPLNYVPVIAQQATRISDLVTFQAVGNVLKKQHKREVAREKARKRLPFRLFTVWTNKVFKGELNLEELKERCTEYTELDKKFSRLCHYLEHKWVGPQAAVFLLEEEEQFQPEKDEVEAPPIGESLNILQVK